jgi:hypothetical protein
MLDHAGRAAVPHPHDAFAPRRRRGVRLSYVALIGRENPLSSMRRDG